MNQPDVLKNLVILGATVIPSWFSARRVVTFVQTAVGAPRNPTAIAAALNDFAARLMLYVVWFFLAMTLTFGFRFCLSCLLALARSTSSLRTGRIDTWTNQCSGNCMEMKLLVLFVSCGLISFVANTLVTRVFSPIGRVIFAGALDFLSLLAGYLLIGDVGWGLFGSSWMGKIGAEILDSRRHPKRNV